MKFSSNPHLIEDFRSDLVQDAKMFTWGHKDRIPLLIACYQLAHQHSYVGSFPCDFQLRVICLMLWNPNPSETRVYRTFTLNKSPCGFPEMVVGKYKFVLFSRTTASKIVKTRLPLKVGRPPLFWVLEPRLWRHIRHLPYFYCKEFAVLMWVVVIRKPPQR